MCAYMYLCVYMRAFIITWLWKNLAKYDTCFYCILKDNYKNVRNFIINITKNQFIFCCGQEPLFGINTASLIFTWLFFSLISSRISFRSLKKWTHKNRRKDFKARVYTYTAKHIYIYNYKKSKFTRDYFFFLRYEKFCWCHSCC